jgi:hypothetical protein
MFAEVRKRAGGLTDQQRTYVDAVRAGSNETDAAKAAGYSKAPKGDKIAKAIRGEEVGDWTDAARNYAFRLAIERIKGEPLDEMGFETYAQRRGHELEPEARNLHAMLIDADIERAGVVLSDDGKFGASADGLVGADGGSEYKCLIDPSRIRAILFDGDLSEFTDQIQGCMWLTDRAWWDFCLYCPALEPVNKQMHMERVQRNDDYIEAMERDLVAFDRLVQEYEARLRGGDAAKEAA